VFCIVVQYGHFLSCIVLCFVRVLSLGCCDLVVSTTVPVQVTDCKDSSPKWPIMIKFIRQMTAIEYKIYTKERIKSITRQNTTDDDCVQLLIRSLCLV